MEKSIAEWEKYKKRYNGEYVRRSCISTVNIWLNDFFQDIGCNSRRKKGLLAELFQPSGPADYAGIFCFLRKSGGGVPLPTCIN
jgi:dimethylaniline monooxygenase (N-oxide forming)